MKTFNKIFLGLGIAASALGLSSCVGDLDREPRDPSEKTDVTGDMDAVFADIFLNFSTYGANGNSPVGGFDGGMAAFQRAMFIAEEIPTDEACWLWDPADYGESYNGGLFNPNQGCLYGAYSRLIINITLCNQFIQNVENGYFNDSNSERAANYVLQAKALWGACYYYMLSFYNDVPYLGFNAPVGSMPEQLPRAEVYNRVVAAMEEVVAGFKAENPNQKPVYGYVGLDMAQSVLAKIYLNAKEFSGTADWQNCYKNCKEIIDRLGHGGYYGNGLVRSYNAIFGANNDQYVVGNPGNEVNEIIWSIVGDNVNLTSFSGAGFLQAGWIGTNGVEKTMGKPTQNPELNNKTEETADGNIVYTYYANAEDYAAAVESYDKLDAKESWKKIVSEVVNGTAFSFDPNATGYIAQDWYNAGYGWKCMVARKSFVRKFEWDDAAMSVSKDRRVSLWQTSAHGFTAENISLVGDDWGNNGYLCPKYSNWAYNEDGTINEAASPTNIGSAKGDYAAIRLAEIYLTAAEAILNGGGGSQAEALQYVNYIRERAYGDAPGDTSHHWASLNMNDLQNERCRELYQENVRRTDLIRWGLWTTGYTWEWKGAVASGTNLPEYTKCFPIPTRVMTASNFRQTAGY
ncbi:MAG: RagB/SusD family nutrient uptake outer membrane protein [Muribaculaceae bacterium]|nr:RagB/SusD family nutrient uptake outer membrane protein [Muribaculaceae bacterium]MDE6866809.1 RagB/SusD family nutrient uptake outer membrane protein [Muribaculaceae bacterium]